jgi:hypothetical protein
MHGVIPPAVVQAIHQVTHPAVLLPREKVPCEQDLSVPPVQPGGQLLVEGLEVSEQLPAGLHRRLVMAADIGAVVDILAAGFQKVAGEDRQDENPSVAPGSDDPIQLIQCHAQERERGDHEVFYPYFSVLQYAINE